MDVNERDPVTGRETTGHVWNGIKELDTPVPRGILLFLIITHIWAIGWWFFAPTWPLGTTYTKGFLGLDQGKMVQERVVAADAARADWVNRINSDAYDAILADQGLMAIVRSTGNQLFGDNCAACHGRDGRGQANYPDLTDDDWLWGGGPELIEETMRVGINSSHPDSRVAQMPAFGRDEMIDQTELRAVAAYVYSLSNPDYSTADNIARIETGEQVFAENCAACHGDDAKGSVDAGAPNLTDSAWVYGGQLETIIESIHAGREGHMPTWEARLSNADIRILALYVHDLGTRRR